MSRGHTNCQLLMTLGDRAGLKERHASLWSVTDDWCDCW